MYTMFLQPWVLKAKNAMTLEDLKQLLIEVGNGLQVFKDQIKWQKRVDSITSFSLVSILLYKFQMANSEALKYHQYIFLDCVEEKWKYVKKTKGFLGDFPYSSNGWET